MGQEFKKIYVIQKNDEDIYDIEGIATEYGIVDKSDEIMVEGAFDNDIGKVIPVYVMHEGVSSTVGTVQLSKGPGKVLVKGRLFDNDLGKTIALAKNAGVKYNLSIGGNRIEYGWVERNGKEYLETRKGTISEVSITHENGQAHPSAVVTKSLKEGEKMNEEILRAIKGLAERMDKAEDGQAEKEEMQKMKVEIADLKEKLEKTEGLEKSAKLEERLNSFVAVVEKMDKTMNEISAPGNFEGGINKSMQEEYEKFEKALHNKALEGQEFAKAMDSTQGAALIPELLANEIIKDLKVASPFYADSKIYRGSGKSLEVPIRASWTNTVEAVAEGSGVVTKGTPDFTARLEITAGVLQSEIPVTDEMRDDSAFPIDQEIREIATEDFAETLSTQILSGTGSGEYKFEGILTNATLIANALATESASKVTADDLLNMETEIKKQYRSGMAKYYVSTDLYREMKKFKGSDGQYLWQAPVASGAPSTFNGYPVVECEDMADIADGAYPCFFGDLTKGYAIFERVGMETEMDRLASNRMWNHITRMRVGGKVRNSNALVLLEVTAAII